MLLFTGTDAGSRGYVERLWVSFGGFCYHACSHCSGARGIDDKAMHGILGVAHFAAGWAGGAGAVGGAELEQRLLPAAGGILRVLLSAAYPCVLSALGLARPAAAYGLLAVPDPAPAGLAAAAGRL